MIPPDLTGLGHFVRTYRHVLGISQTELGRRVGWLQERVSLLESGRYGLPSLPALIRMSEVLAIPFGELLAATGYPGLREDAMAAEDMDPNPALRYALQYLLEIDSGTLIDSLGRAAVVMLQAMGADAIEIAILDPVTAESITVARQGVPGSGPAGETQLRYEGVFRTGVTAYLPQREYPVHAHGAPGMRSYLTVPLRSNGDIMGVMAAESEYPDRFTAEEQRLFTAAARWVGMLARRAELTERVAREAASDARRLVAEDLIVSLAHDLGNAITPVKGRLDLMARRLRRETREQDATEIDGAAANLVRMQRILNDLLDVAQMPGGFAAPVLQPVDLVALVTEVAARCEAGGTTVMVRLPADLPVRLEPRTVTNALQHLVTTVSRSRGAEGQPVIEVNRVERDGQSWVVIIVGDGQSVTFGTMASHRLRRFTSGREFNGLGLGLYLARTTADAHGGTLQLADIPGAAACFVLSLPVDPPVQVERRAYT